MSYAITLGCGCGVYVACHPMTGMAHTRIIEQRAPGCTIRSHDVGVRLQSWELRPHATVPRLITPREEHRSGSCDERVAALRVRSIHDLASREGER